MPEALRRNRNILLIAALCLVKLGLHLLTNQTYGFHRDEFLYMDYGHHLAAGFYDIPPLTPILAWVSQTLLDESVFALRFLPAVSGTATLLLALLLAKELGARGFALLVTGLVLICSALLRVDTMFEPVTFDVFFWTLCTWLLLRFLRTASPGTLIWLGVAFGLGVLNKYNLLLLGIGAFAALMVHKPGIIKDRIFQLATGIFLLVVSPNLIWQVLHGMPVFGHIEKLSRTQFVHVSRELILVSQFAFFGPGSLLWILGLVCSARGYLTDRQTGTRLEAPFLRPLVWIFGISLVVLLLFQGKSYYLLGVYPALVAVGAVQLEGWLSSWLVYLIEPVYVLLVAIYGLLLIPGAVPILSIEKVNDYCNWVNANMGIELRKWEDGKIHPIPQDFSDMYGWVECGQKACYWYYSIPEKERKDYIITASNYGLAAAVDYFGENRNLPDVYNDTSGMIDWVPDSIHAHRVLYIGSTVDHDLRDHFKTVKIVDSITNPYARENGTYIAIASDCKEDLPALWKRIYRERKKAGPFRH